MKIENAKIRKPSESLYNEKKKASRGIKNRVSILDEEKRGEFLFVETDKLLPYRNQARKFFDEEKIKSLSQTIKEHGIRQPLTIIEHEAKLGFYEVVSGERRLKAAVKAGLKKVPCLIIHDKAKADEIAIIENIQREDLHPIELGEAYKKLQEMNDSLTHEEISSRLGVGRTHVTECIRLTTLPTEVKKTTIDENLRNRDFLRGILNCRGRDEMLKLIYSKTSSEKKEVKTPVSKKMSVLRVSFDGREFIVQKNKLKTLGNKQRLELQKLLKSVLVEL